MTSFQEFLAGLARQTNYQELRARREEWAEAVRRLLDQLRSWLAESDPTGVLEVIALEVEKVEPSLGLYRVPSLKIGVGNAAVQIVPMGRDSIGTVALPGKVGLRAEGRVDVTDGLRKYILYRTLSEGNESWYALDERFQAAPLDRRRFEEILQDLLS